jgi:hypothetical protein
VTNGEEVRLYPGTTDAFIVAKYTEYGIFGTVSGTIETGQVGWINLINTLKYSDLLEIPKNPAHKFSEIGNPSSRESLTSSLELTTDNLIVLNSATDITFALLSANGSNRIRQIANRGVGEVTIIPYGTNTINDETTQVVRQGDCMVIKD